MRATMTEAPDEIADELYGAPFDEFIARRDAAARDLRREKRREEADAVKALRKPALSAWAVDQLVRRDRDLVDGLLAAGAALRQARGGDALRDATHDERDAVEDLVAHASSLLRDAGHPVTDKTVGELRDTLHAVALDDEARALIERGRLVEPRRAVGLGGLGFGGSQPGPGAASEATDDAPARRKTPARPDAKDERARARAAGKEERERQRERVKAAREALREAERTVRDRESALADAEEGLSRAQDALDDAREALDDARSEADRRRAALDEASG
jgi:hypothetical protein